MLQMVGAGPAALGVFVAADRVGGLEDLLRSGVVVCDRLESARELRRYSLGYEIRSNSTASEFLAGVPEDGLLAPVLSSEAACALRAAGNAPAPLYLVADFLSALRDRVFQIMARFPSCRAVLGTKVVRVVCAAESYATIDAAGSTIARSPLLLLAAGAEPPPLPRDRGSTSAGVPTFCADSVMRGHALNALMRAGEKSRAQPLVVVGGSHSAFAICALLLERFGTHFGPGDICLVHRRAVRLYYPSIECAVRSNYHFDPVNDVCPVTGEVNRFGGLRAYAKELYLNVVSGQERRLRLVCAPMIAASPRAAFPASVLILATGYRARAVPLVDSQGKGIETALAEGEVLLDQQFQIVRAAGGSMDGCFGLGLGYRQACSTLGEPSYSRGRAGVNLFNGDFGESIAREILRRLCAPTYNAVRVQ